MGIMESEAYPSGPSFGHLSPTGPAGQTAAPWLPEFSAWPASPAHTNGQEERGQAIGNQGLEGTLLSSPP